MDGEKLEDETKLKKKLTCSKKIVGTARDEGSVCTQDIDMRMGKKYQIGFSFDILEELDKIKKVFVPYIDICYDTIHIVPLYTKHTIYGDCKNNIQSIKIKSSHFIIYSIFSHIKISIQT